MTRFVRILLVAGLLSPGAAYSAALGLVPDDPDPAPGSVVAIEVVVEDLQIACFSFSVEYDAAVLQYLGAEEGTLFSAAPEMSFFSDDVDEFGRPQPNDCLLGAGSAVTGPGPIAVLRFEVLGDDGTSVWVRDATLRDVDRLPLPDFVDTGIELGSTSTSAPGVRPDATLSAHPNPSSSRLSLVLSGRDLAQPGRLEIFDAAGRRIRELDWPAGARARGWDGRDAGGRVVANGVYHARLVSSGRMISTRIVRVR